MLVCSALCNGLFKIYGLKSRDNDRLLLIVNGTWCCSLLPLLTYCTDIKKAPSSTSGEAIQYLGKQTAQQEKSVVLQLYQKKEKAEYIPVILCAQCSTPTKLQIQIHERPETAYVFVSIDVDAVTLGFVQLHVCDIWHTECKGLQWTKH